MEEIHKHKILEKKNYSCHFLSKIMCPLKKIRIKYQNGKNTNHHHLAHCGPLENEKNGGFKGFDQKVSQNEIQF